MAGRAEPALGAELLALLRALAAEDLPGVIEAAREEARVRARARLADVLTEEMLAARTAAPEPGGAAAGDGLYVLCVVPAGTRLPVGARGIGGAELRSIEHGELAAVLCPVPLREFGEDALREHLQDMRWLEQTARAHEAALEQIGATATLVPLRLCTVFHAESGVRELLHREAERLGAALAHLDGRREWGVKVFAGPQPAAEPADAPGDGASGADYLRRRSEAREERARRADVVHAATTAIHQQLAELAADARSNPPQRPEVSGGEHPMVLNGAYLVADEHLDAFADTVHELAGAHAPLGLEIELTGPWPAYNFIPDAIGVA